MVLTNSNGVSPYKWLPGMVPVSDIIVGTDKLTLITPIGKYAPHHLNPDYFSANPHDPGKAYRLMKGDFTHLNPAATYGMLEQIDEAEYAWEIEGRP